MTPFVQSLQPNRTQGIYQVQVYSLEVQAAFYVGWHSYQQTMS